MLQVARMAPSLLRDSSQLVHDFILGQLSDSGGFLDREGVPDLYYSVFGIDCLLALQADVPKERLRPYLETFGDGEGLDLVHLACLTHCFASIGELPPESTRRALAQRIQTHRAGDGGFSGSPGSEHGTVYGCFLAMGSFYNLDMELPDPDGVLASLADLRSADGAYSNEPNFPEGGTPPTAAAVTLLRHLGQAPPAEAGDWLAARMHESGGFLAIPRAPLPDLLSTATALHALSGLEVSIEPYREPCLDFIDTLWTNRGSFHGHWADEALDCEYTWYGLLALGHLSL